MDAFGSADAARVLVSTSALACLVAFAAAGIEGVMVMPVGPDPVAFTSQLAVEVVPRLQGLSQAQR